MELFQRQCQRTEPLRARQDAAWSIPPVMRTEKEMSRINSNETNLLVYQYISHIQHKARLNPSVQRKKLDLSKKNRKELILHLADVNSIVNRCC